MAIQRKRARFLDGSLFAGAVLTGLFYWFINQEQLRDTLLHKYTTEHFTEYVIVAIFFWGAADLVRKCLGFRRETLALGWDWLPPRTGPEPAAKASEHYENVKAVPGWLQETRVGARLRQALASVHEKGSAEGFEEHLRHLRERDADRTHANYAVPRFIVWVAPVLGFLGTVVHFGVALGSLSADELSAKLPLAVAGMGTAFNTTTMALGVSTLMMFFLFLIERTEQGIVAQVDALVESELSNRFAVEDAQLGPFLGVIQSAAKAALAAMHESVERQLQVWSENLAAVEHSNQQRQEQQIADWQAALLSQQQRHEVHDRQREDHLRQVLETLASQRTEHASQVQATIEQTARLEQHLASLTETLAGVLAGEGHLVRLQETLAENLRLLHQTQQFDEAMHGLTAAIHLLTARHEPAAKKAA